MPTKLAILGSTRGTSLQPIIEAIKNGDLEATIELIISNKPDAYILERAKLSNIPAIFLNQGKKNRNEFDEDVMNLLEEKNIDLILLIGYMRFISKQFVQKWNNKIMNVHPSLLPAFAGGMDLNVHKAVLASGAKESGCTIHYVDEGADTGEIIVQKKCLIDPYETPESLKAKVQALEGPAFIEAIKKFQKTI